MPRSILLWLNERALRDQPLRKRKEKLEQRYPVARLDGQEGRE
jgi:hypothetical protein